VSVLKVALLGAGSMAARHARTVSSSGRARLEVVIDRDRDRADALARTHSARSSIDPAEAFGCDAAIVAVATEAHLTLAEPLIRQRVPVLLEKPLADCLYDTRALITTAQQLRVPLMCGFVERFNPAVRAVFELATGVPETITTVRQSPPPPRPHGDVVNDVLLHDLDLVHLFTGGQRSTRIDVMERSVTADGAAEMVDCVVQFDGGTTATLSASRVSCQKVRTTKLVYPGLVLDLDLLRPAITLSRDGSRGKAWAQHGDSLTAQFEHFLAVIDGRVDQDVERASILPAHELADAISRSAA